MSALFFFGVSSAIVVALIFILNEEGEFDK